MVCTSVRPRKYTEANPQCVGVLVPLSVHVCNMNSKYEYIVPNQNNKEKMRPQNVGTIHNLPDDVRILIGLGDDDDDASTSSSHHDIVWTTFDTEFGHLIAPPAVYGRVLVGSLLAIPCACPLLVVCGPWLWSIIVAEGHSIRHAYWILTNRDVKVVVRTIDHCCDRRAARIKSIPLEYITECSLQEHKPVRGGYTMPAINIDTVCSKDGLHEAIGMGLVGYDWFRTEILYRRDNMILKIPTVPVCAIVVKCATAMDRGSTTSGTKEEYEMKRQKIIASI
jgi:hypothetical protein